MQQQFLITVPKQARRILFLGGDNVSAQVLTRVMASEPGPQSPVAAAKVLRPLVTKERRNNSHSHHHVLDAACRNFNLQSSCVADSKKLRLTDLAVALGMMPAADVPLPLPTTSKNPNPLVVNPIIEPTTCPFTEDQIREEFLNQFDATVVASFKHYIPDSL